MTWSFVHIPFSLRLAARNMLRAKLRLLCIDFLHRQCPYLCLLLIEVYNYMGHQLWHCDWQISFIFIWFWHWTFEPRRLGYAHDGPQTMAKYYLCLLHFRLNYDHDGNICVHLFNSIHAFFGEFLILRVKCIKGSAESATSQSSLLPSQWSCPTMGILDLVTHTCESLVKDLILEVLACIEPFFIALTSCEVTTLYKGHHLGGAFWSHFHQVGNHAIGRPSCHILHFLLI